jgi:hypothetical protein
VRAQEARPQGHRQPGGHGADAEAGRVRGHHRPRAHPLGHAREEAALDLEVLHHRLQDPVRVAKLVPVVLEIAHPDAGRVFGQVQGRRLQPLEGVQRAPGQAAAVGSSFGGHQVQQRHVEAAAHEVGGDLGAHGAGAEDDGLAEGRRHQAAAPPS